MPQARHVHANVPIVSAADLNFVESPVVHSACDAPIGALPENVRGRNAQVKQLLEYVAEPSGRVLVLSGQPGSGKSTVALAMVRRLPQYPQVCWVSGHNLDMFIEGMAAVACKLGANDAETARARESGSHDLIWRLVPTPTTKRVLIIDGADEPEFCSRVIRGALTLVQARWLTIVTTRALDPGILSGAEKTTFIHVRWPSEEHCAELMLDRIPKMSDLRRRTLAMPSALEIARLLGRVPLALHLAGSDQGSTIVRHTPDGYLGELRKMLTRHGFGSDESAHHLLPAMELALRGFGSEERDTALRFLWLLSAFAPGQPVPLAVLTAAGGGPDEPLVDRSVRLLIHTGLIGVASYDDVQVVVIHPSIAKSASRISDIRGARVTPIAAATSLDTVTEAIDAGSAQWAGTPDTWHLWRLLIPHVTHMLADLGSDSDEMALLRTAHRAIQHMMKHGMYRSAEKMATASVARASKLGDHLPAVLRAARLDQALTRQALGEDLELAFRGISNVAMETRKARQEGEPESAEMMAAQHHLAVIMHQRGDLKEATKLFEQVQQSRENCLGLSHADTLTTMHFHAAVLQESGRPTDAERLLRRTIEGRIDLLGPEHPDTLATQHSLAYARQAAGGPDSLPNAEQDFRNVLDARKRILGPTHPDTLISRHNLVWIEQVRGNYTVAEKGFRSVMETQIARLGRSHPHTIATAANLAWVLLLQRQFSIARRLFTQVLKIRTARLGIDHPDTQTTRGNISWLTYEEGQFHLAEYRFRKLVEDRRRLLPVNHPRTLTTRHNLALSLRSQRRLTEARNEFKAVLDAQLETIKDDHDSLLATKYNLAVTLRMLNDESARRRAMTYLDEVLAALRGRIGPPHPLLRQTKREIVTILAIGSGRADVHDLVDDDADDLAAAPLVPADDPLLRQFVDGDIDDFTDPDLLGYIPPPAP